jgi:hypothetical protein
MTIREIAEVIRSVQLPEGVEGQLAAQRLDRWFASELHGKTFWAADLDANVAILVLEHDKAVLYEANSPHEISRELLNLNGAVVRTSYELGDDYRARLTLELQDGRSLGVRPRLPADFEDLDALRVEIEKRVSRLGH